MTPEQPQSDDPLIDEVRRRRREVAEEYGYDLKQLFDELKRRDAEHPERLVDPRKHPEKV
ncbi:MAG TPA: hypothetical protein VJZ71_15645 [Phycisphaerae bacterium]|nr:hypothetical protein [Phycisphaerae bacterium]